MEENQKIIKSYYRLSENQLDRLRDLLKKVSIENRPPQSLPHSLRKRREVLFLWELISIGLLCTHAFPIVAFLLVVTLFLGMMDVVKHIISTNLMAWHAVLIFWGLPLLVLLICNRLIRVSKKKETDQLMNAANRLLMASENIPQEALSQGMVSLKYFMSVMKWGTDFNQNDIQREDFRISRLKQLLGKINPNRFDIPDSKWGNLQLVQTWIVIADILFCSVLCYFLMFSGYISVTFKITFSLLSILMIGMIIVYKGLLQFQKKKAKQELAELLQLADKDAKRIKEQQLELSEELIQELDDCVYEVRESSGITV